MNQIVFSRKTTIVKNIHNSHRLHIVANILLFDRQNHSNLMHMYKYLVLNMFRYSNKVKYK